MGSGIRYMLWLFVVLFSLQLVNAAVISGTVYDLSLQPESNVIIEINSTPKQLLVSKSGDYAFNVKPGTYTLYAHTNISSANEYITVPDNDTYTLDIIMQESMVELPDYILSDSDSDVNVSLTDLSEPTTKVWVLVLIGVLILLALFAIGFYFFIRARMIKSLKQLKSVKHGKKSRHKSRLNNSSNSTQKIHDIKQEQNESMTDYDIKVLGIIKKEKRTTQKDLRKEIPLSEAKISLIITDLESKGKIRKIKKGRGNILIFVKD